GNQIPDLKSLLKDIQQKVGDKARFLSSSEAYKSDAEEFLSVHISDVPEGSLQEEEPEEVTDAKDSAWQRRQRRRKAKELALKEEEEEEEEDGAQSDESKDKAKKKGRAKADGKKKRAKKENGKVKKKKKKRSKRDKSAEGDAQENGEEEQPVSEEPTEEGDAGSDEGANDASAGAEDEPQEKLQQEQAEQAESEAEVKQPVPAQTFDATALSTEEQISLKKATEEKLRGMEGLLANIGDSALDKLAQLTVRLLVSGKDMLAELKPFVGKQQATELVAWVEEHCRSREETSNTAEEST
ncbi:unnamed protein product, partial [Symbiodinium pilosum]